MSKVKLLHFADLHIGIENYGRLDLSSGLNGRVHDFLQRLDEIVEYGLGHDVDVVVFAGDAYRRSNPTPTFQRAFAKRIKRLADAGVYIVLLVGNHDIPSMVQRASSIDIFKTLDVPNVIVGGHEEIHVCVTRNGPIQIATLPFPVRQRLLVNDEFRGLSIEALDHRLEEAVGASIETLTKQVDATIPAVLTAHLSVSEATYGSERGVMLGRDTVIQKSALDNRVWDYIALGHVHKHQSLNEGSYPHIVYAGSPARADFAEEGQPKGFCWVEVARGATTWEFVPLHARPFITVRVDLRDELSPLMTLQQEIAKHDLAEAVVRLIVKLRAEQEPLLNERDIREMLSDAYYVGSIFRDMERQNRLRLNAAAPEKMTDADLLGHYFRERGLDDSDRIASLKRYATDIFAADDDR